MAIFPSLLPLFRQAAAGTHGQGRGGAIAAVGNWTSLACSDQTASHGLLITRKRSRSGRKYVNLKLIKLLHLN